jgi:hypothetical protein
MILDFLNSVAFSVFYINLFRNKYLIIMLFFYYIKKSENTPKNCYLPKPGYRRTDNIRL